MHRPYDDKAAAAAAAAQVLLDAGGRPKGGTLAALDVTARPTVWEPARVLGNSPGPYSRQEQSKLAFQPVCIRALDAERAYYQQSQAESHIREDTGSQPSSGSSSTPGLPGAAPRAGLMETALMLEVPFKA
ncbi:MAG: hypothetical protein FRX49_08070 [Trebouxia sp. A1-2]|nr:MAG: hypothetical protein FRX49_08070 [Trebouxia sp. A1-2]